MRGHLSSNEGLSPKIDIELTVPIELPPGTEPGHCQALLERIEMLFIEIGKGFTISPAEGGWEDGKDLVRDGLRIVSCTIDMGDWKSGVRVVRTAIRDIQEQGKQRCVYLEVAGEVYGDPLNLVGAATDSYPDQEDFLGIDPVVDEITSRRSNVVVRVESDSGFIRAMRSFGSSSTDVRPRIEHPDLTRIRAILRRNDESPVLLIEAESGTGKSSQIRLLWAEDEEQDQFRAWYTTSKTLSESRSSPESWKLMTKELMATQIPVLVDDACVRVNDTEHAEHLDAIKELHLHLRAPLVLISHPECNVAIDLRSRDMPAEFTTDLDISDTDPDSILDHQLEIHVQQMSADARKKVVELLRNRSLHPRALSNHLQSTSSGHGWEIAEIEDWINDPRALVNLLLGDDKEHTANVLAMHRLLDAPIPGINSIRHIPFTYFRDHFGDDAPPLSIGFAQPPAGDHQGLVFIKSSADIWVEAAKGRLGALSSILSDAEFADCRLALPKGPEIEEALTSIDESIQGLRIDIVKGREKNPTPAEMADAILFSLDENLTPETGTLLSTLQWESICRYIQDIISLGASGEISKQFHLQIAVRALRCAQWSDSNSTLSTCYQTIISNLKGNVSSVPLGLWADAWLEIADGPDHLSTASIARGKSFQQQAQSTEAKNAFQRAMEHAKGSEDPLIWCTAARNYARALFKEGEMEKSLQYFNEVLEVLEAIEENRTVLEDIATTLANIARHHRNIQDSEKALEFFFRSLEISEKISDRLSIARSCGEIAGVMRHLGRREECESYTKRCKDINAETGDLRGYALGLCGWISTQVYFEQADSTLEALDEVEEIANRLDHWQIRVSHKMQQSKVYFQLGREEEAIEAALETLRLNRKARDVPGTASSLVTIAMMYRDTEQLEEAAEVFGEAVELQKQAGRFTPAAKSSFVRAQILQKLQRWDEAQEEFLRCTEINDLLGDEELATKARSYAESCRTTTVQGIVMHSSTLEEKGFGFIQHEGEANIFFHSSFVEGEVSEGDSVDVTFREVPKGPQATNVRKIEP